MGSMAQRLRENLKEAERRMQQAVCPIYGIDRQDRPQLIGSSVLFRVKEQSFLVTAAHVLDFNKESTIHIGGPTELVELTGNSYRVRPPPSGREADVLDFGFVDISNTPTERWSRYRFLTPHDLDVDDVPARHALYGFVGFPETRNRPQARTLQLSSIVCVLVPSPAERYDSLRLNPVTHFAGEFDREKQLDPEKGLITGPDPRGLSGGGVWRMGLPEEFANDTNSERLIAIGIEHRKSAKALVGVRVALVLAMIAKVYPALASEMPRATYIRANVVDIAEIPPPSPAG
jgi:hypothetical protein